MIRVRAKYRTARQTIPSSSRPRKRGQKTFALVPVPPGASGSKGGAGNDATVKSTDGIPGGIIPVLFGRFFRGVRTDETGPRNKRRDGESSVEKKRAWAVVARIATARDCDIRGDMSDIGPFRAPCPHRKQRRHPTA